TSTRPGIRSSSEWSAVRHWKRQSAISPRSSSKCRSTTPGASAAGARCASTSPTTNGASPSGSRRPSPSPAPSSSTWSRRPSLPGNDVMPPRCQDFDYMPPRTPPHRKSSAARQTPLRERRMMVPTSGGQDDLPPDPGRPGPGGVAIRRARQSTTYREERMLPMNRRRIGSVSLIVLLAAAPAPLAAQDFGAASESTAPYRLMLQPESRLWFKGGSTVRGFECQATAIEGRSVLEIASGERTLDALGQANADVTLECPVAALDCDNGTMNDHMRKALQADEHPVI